MNIFSDPSLLPLIIWFLMGFFGWVILWKKAAANFQLKSTLILLFVFAVPLGLVTLLVALICPELKVCLYCKSIMRKDAIVCSRCGREQHLSHATMR
jgi:hypothetical protein